VPAFAAGGFITRPTLALVGEAGPEMIVPLTGEGAGGGITITIKSVVIRKDADIEDVARKLAREVRKQGLGGGASYFVPDFFAFGFSPTASFAARPTARPAFLPASERLPAGLLAFGRFRLPTTFRAASATPSPAFLADSDSRPAGLLILDFAIELSP
jgi:hypothetical protein